MSVPHWPDHIKGVRKCSVVVCQCLLEGLTTSKGHLIKGGVIKGSFKGSGCSTEHVASRFK